MDDDETHDTRDDADWETAGLRQSAAIRRAEDEHLAAGDVPCPYCGRWMTTDEEIARNACGAWACFFEDRVAGARAQAERGDHAAACGALLALGDECVRRARDDERRERAAGE